MRTTLLMLAFSVMFVSSSHAQQCLHGDAESPAEAARRREALSAARLINTLQASQPGASQGRYLKHEELASPAPVLPPSIKLTPGEEIVTGWRLTLDVTPRGYWFSITDTADPCGFRYISNEAGLIFRAEPIR